MTWKAPIAWLAGRLATAATMNAQVSGNASWLAGPDRCQVTNSAAQSVATSATLLTWNTNTVISNASMHSTTTNPSRLIAATAGTYRLDLSLVMAAANLYVVDVRKNAAGSSIGGVSLRTYVLSAGVGIFTGSLELWLDVNEYVELFGTSTGAAANLQASTFGTFAGFRWIGV